MLYYLFNLLAQQDFPGARLMGYISVRFSVALILSLFIAIFIGKKIIRQLQKQQVGEIIRDLGLEGQMKKTGTPTMGGIIIIIAILIPCLLVGDLTSVYMLLMLVTTLWLGVLGFLDDWIKVVKKNKEGMSGRYKIIGQVGLGLIVGLTMYLSPDIVIRENTEVQNVETSEIVDVVYESDPVKTPLTTIPFVKNNNFDYGWLTSWAGEYAETAAWILFIIVTVFVVTATSNGANLTDGLDGLATGSSAIIGAALAIMAYLGSNVIYSSYLNIMYIPGSEELVVYMAAFIGALIGFLWYNAYPAQVFMGDTGSLTLGGIIAVFALLIHKELLLPLLCAIFFVEDLSVMMQVAYFKYTKKKYGTGRRIFKMTPLHHHYQKPGNAGIDALIQNPIQPVPESKIVTRFWIIGLIFAVMTFVTLKIR
ncbi:MAG: phospho-N-acetylmuramoyl-pentapeptide-transferase [Barnesiella sp.]|nr:phospho-N-acetylmuramoyl-pentapeptide-transferase [Bacteroidales bacterium]MBD5245724.1 phospho-N-acetylmuramoyl-pentapeptide-transferase [Barnesiella sp.]MBD5248972.1 phospho-N-acetylmuramoyl-pentapeptide-transferase [Barnesiella sp.]MDE6082086.1 phospho-N-acetylmuramoyl-pentapeptide-transferase [Muribaculaceae bacterium]